MAEGSRRRGRPRKHPLLIDQGTPELQRHRATLAGSADASLAEDPLALMVAKGLVLPTQAQAGRYYASLYRRAVGRSHLSTNAHYQRLAMNSPGTPFDGDEAAVAEARQLYRRGKRRLLKAGRLVAQATEDLVVFGVRPPFLTSGSSRSEPKTKKMNKLARENAYFRAILIGLDELAAGYGLREPDRRP